MEISERTRVAIDAFMDTACGAVTALCFIFMLLIVVVFVIPLNFGQMNALILYVTIMSIAGIYLANLSVKEALERYDRRHAGGLHSN
jgi:hypothetical protein